MFPSNGSERGEHMPRHGSPHITFSPFSFFFPKGLIGPEGRDGPPGPPGLRVSNPCSLSDAPTHPRWPQLHGHHCMSSNRGLKSLHPASSALGTCSEN